MAIVGVIPAAGYARRLQPLSCSKEVYPIAGRPVIDYVAERMWRAGCSELRIVTRPEKTDVVEYARHHAAHIVEASPRSVCESILAGMRGLDDDDVVLLGFPDTIWEPADGYSPLIAAVQGSHELALGLFQTEDLERSDVVRFGDAGTIAGVEVKPAVPPSSWIWGCCAARARILWGLEGFRDPGSYFDAVCRSRRVAGVRLSDAWIDIGTKTALRAAGGRGDRPRRRADNSHPES